MGGVGSLASRPSAIPTGVRHEISALFPAWVSGWESADYADAEDLYPEERSVVSRAVEKRRMEFALGRTCARRALGQLGVAPAPLPAKADRSVAWPAGIWGSISHAEGLCVAVCARSEHVSGIGVDVEQRQRVSPHLWPQIAGPRERAWLAGLPSSEALTFATALFSAKEAFYKAQHCITQAWVGFHDAEFELVDGDTFEIALLGAAGVLPAGARFRGRIALLSDHVVTAMVITPAAGHSRE